MGRLFRVAYGTALFGPAAAVVFLVLRYGVNVPFGDQWDFVSYFVAMDGGSLSFAALFAPHNEHRILFPRLLMLGLGHLSQWDVRVEMLSSIVLAGGSLALLMRMARPALSASGPATRIWAAFTMSAMLFSVVQWENWLWGWQVAWFLSVFAAIASTALAIESLGAARPWPHVAGAALAAIVSQYSIGSGTAVWATSAAILACHPRRRAILPAWLAMAAGATAIYLAGLDRPAELPPLLGQPLPFVVYVANYLAGPLGRHAAIGIGVTIAFAILAFLAVARRPRDPAVIAPWLALGVFAGANAALTAAGRVGMGAGQGLSSRYVTVGLLLSLSLVPLGIHAYRAWPAARSGAVRSRLWLAGAGLLTLLVIGADVLALGGARRYVGKMVAGRDCVLEIRTATDDCLRHVHPDPELVRERAEQLHALALSTFAKADARLQLAGPGGTTQWRLPSGVGFAGHLDVATLQGDALTVSGWARHPDGNLAAPRRVLVVADGTIVGEAAVVEERPDVAAHLGKPDLSRSGWRLRVAGFVPAARPVRVSAFLILKDGVLVPLWREATPATP